MSTAELPRTARLLPSRVSQLGVGLAVAAWAVTPLVIDDDFWMTVLANAGAFAIAAIGLSLLTGYTGQVSLGHAAFLTIGGYTVGYFGGEQGWPLPVWLLLAAAAGGLVGAVVGPFALRFKGNYLAVVTLALVFVTVHVVQNWDGFTGGFNGRSTNGAPLALGPLDFGELDLLGKQLSREQGLFYLAWILVALTALVARNIVRTRPGRAMQAIRDRDLAAEVLGVSNARYKIIAFAVSSAMAAVGGAVYAVNLRFISPNEPVAELFVSIRFVAIIIVGGIGTVYGAVIGALLLGPLPELVVEFLDVLDFNLPVVERPLVTQTAAGDGIFTAAVFSEILFGLLLISFLLFQPDGLAGLVRRIRAGLARRRRDR